MDLQTEFNFVAPNELYEVEKPFKFGYRIRDKIPNARQTNVELDKRNVTVKDIRGRENEFVLEESGFEILRHTTQVPLSAINETDIKEAYKKEIELLLMTRLNAYRVIAFNIEVFWTIWRFLKKCITKFCLDSR